MMLIALSTMLLTTACSSEDDLVNNTANTENTINKGYALPVTVSATRGGDATRATFDGSKLNFSAGDKLFVKGNHDDAGNFAGTLDYDAVSGKFSGTIYTKNLYSGTADDLFSAATSIATLLPNGYGSTGFLSINNNSTPDDATDDYVSPIYDKAIALTKNAAVEQLSWERTTSYSSVSGFALSPMNAILNFTITGFAASTQVAVVFTSNNGTVNENVMTDGSGNATFALGVSGGEGLHNCSLTVAGNPITLVSSSKTLTAGKIYNITRSAAPTYTLLSAATTADYGKVVCAAGHLHTAKTAVPSGCTAVGILGKVTSTGHGLILALQDATSQTWNTINGWTTVTVYAGTALKLLPDDAARGSLTSYTTLGSTTVSNWCVAQKSDYEAIFTNLGSTTGDKDGKTFDANVNAYITTGVGGTAISGGHWSATATNDDYARIFRNDYWFNYQEKTTSLSVRPVLAF